MIRRLLEEPESQAKWLERVEAGDFADLRLQRIVALLTESLRAGRPLGLGDVVRELGDDPARDLVARIAVDPAPGTTAAEIEACVGALERRRLQRERRQVQEQMEREKDPGRMDLLMERKIRISKQIDALS